MKGYHVGERFMEDSQGIPVIDADGQEIYILPEEFDYLGMPEADTMQFRAEDLQEGIGEE